MNGPGRLGKLVVYGVIVLLFLAVLALVRAGDRWMPDYLRLAWLIRFPLLGSLILLALSAALWKPVRPLLGGLVVLTRRQLVIATASAVLAMLSISLTARTALQESLSLSAECTRDGENPQADLQLSISEPVRFPELNRERAQWLRGLLGPLGWNPTRTWWQLALVLPLIIIMVLNPRREPNGVRRPASLARSTAPGEKGPNPDRTGKELLIRGLLAFATIAGTVLVAAAASAWLGDRIGRWQLGLPFREQLAKFAGPGYFEPVDGEPKLRGIHLEVAALLVFYLGVYGAGGWLLHPGPDCGWKALRDRWVPPVHYLLLIVTLGVFILMGCSFFLDYWRLSSVILLGLLSFAFYWWLLFDHFFRTESFAQPTKRGCKKAFASAEAAAVIRTDDEKSDFVIVANRADAEKKDIQPAAASLKQAAEASALESGGVRHSGRTMVVITAYGGGILAGSWVVKVVSELMRRLDGFQASTGLISGVSGGSVGTLFLIDELLKQKALRLTDHQVEQLNARIRLSSLEATAWGLAYPGLLRLMVPALISDRCWDNGWALEECWREKLSHGELTLRQLALEAGRRKVPHVILNAVCVENGRRFLLSTDKFQYQLDRAKRSGFGFLGLYQDRDIDLVTAARLSASFPFVSPISRIDEAGNQPPFHFADGGYFDNFGVFSAVEWLRLHLTRREHADEADNPLNGIDRILVVRVSSRQFQRDPTGLRAGWKNALLGPLLTLLSVRGASQSERVKSEIEMLTDWCAHLSSPVAVSLARFELDYQGPLSWQLEPQDEAGLDLAWEPFARALDNHDPHCADPDVDAAVSAVRRHFELAPQE